MKNYYIYRVGIAFPLRVLQATSIVDAKFKAIDMGYDLEHYIVKED